MGKLLCNGKLVRKRSKAGEEYWKGPIDGRPHVCFYSKGNFNVMYVNLDVEATAEMCEKKSRKPEENKIVSQPK